MVIERLIDEVGTVAIPLNDYFGFKYRIVGSRLFNYHQIYWYDGLKFYIGSLEHSSLLTLTESTTGAIAVSSAEIKGKVTSKKLIRQFHEKCAQTKANAGCDIYQVIARYRSNNLDLEAWQINLLTV